MITLMIISIILILLFFRYNPTIDEIKIRDTKLLVLWYNRDFNGENRDYIILWENDNRLT